jgi:hypothetical protein
MFSEKHDLYQIGRPQKIKNKNLVHLNLANKHKLTSSTFIVNDSNDEIAITNNNCCNLLHSQMNRDIIVLKGTVGGKTNHLNYLSTLSNCEVNQ